jgi:hypothetical protein
MFRFHPFAPVTILALAVAAAGCTSGPSTRSLIGGGASPTASPSPAAAPLPASATTTIPLSATAASASLGPVLGGYSSTITVPGGSSSAILTVTLAATQPAGTPAVQTVRRRAHTIGGGTGIAPIAFVTIAANAPVTLGAAPAFSFSVPAATAGLGQPSYVALYDPSASPQLGWTTFQGPGTVSGNTIAFTGSSATLKLVPGVTYDFVLFTVPSALPTPSPAPTSTPAPTPTPAPSPTQAASAQHLYTIVANGVAQFGLPLTASSTPIVTAPAPVLASDGQIGPYLAVNAAHVVYTDTVHDAYFVLDQPIGASSTPSATFCFSGCGDHPHTPSRMTVALSPFGFLAGTDVSGPVASDVIHFFNAPFSGQTVSASSQTIANPAAGLAYDAAGNLFAGGSLLPNGGDVEQYAGNFLLARVKTTMFVSSVAVNASHVVVAGYTNACAGQVLVYSLPLTSSSVPSATITNGLGATCEYFVALDASGYLYVSGAPGGVNVYAPPLSNLSSPAIMLATGFPAQIVIGP